MPRKQTAFAWSLLLRAVLLCVVLGWVIGRLFIGYGNHCTLHNMSVLWNHLPHSDANVQALAQFGCFQWSRQVDYDLTTLLQQWISESPHGRFDVCAVALKNRVKKLVFDDRKKRRLLCAWSRHALAGVDYRPFSDLGTENEDNLEFKQDWDILVRDVLSDCVMATVLFVAWLGLTWWEASPRQKRIIKQQSQLI